MTRSQTLLTTALVLAASVAVAQPSATGVMAPALSPRNASYSIEARLDPAAHAITGSETITWRNITSKPASELQFHLYWNAWRDARSSWLRERALSRPVDNIRPEDWSRIDVGSIRIVDGAQSIELGTRQFIAPDDGNKDDSTVLRVPLPAAREVAPGATVTLQVTWTAHVPRTFSRTGVIGHFFFIAQWFPKLGVLQEGGWNCHQFHAATEFFSDYGVYDVSLQVPAGWMVGATGVERGRRDNADGTTTHRFYQEDVHDFAWTTSPDYLERTARFENPPLPPVEIRLLLQPEHADQADRHFNATRAALKYYGEWYGPYPYGHITVIDPAFQSGAGGMEYPTLFTAGSRWLIRPGVTVPDSVTVHEAGHQFWYAIVGNNEFEDAWMDEGFNSFSQARVLAHAYSPSYASDRYFGDFIPYRFTDFVLRRETQLDRLAGYRSAAKADAQATPTFRYFPGTASDITYAKTALWLDTLERWLGWPVLQRIMATHFARWKYGHPKPQDFFDIANEVSGQDLGWYFDRVYRSSDVFDYGVESLASVRDGEQYRTTVVVRRYGEATFPVEVQITFDDGARVTERWDGRDRWKPFVYNRAVQARSAEVDPNHILLLDANYTNNSRAREPNGPRAATKWATKWMIWLQDRLLTWAFLV